MNFTEKLDNLYEEVRLSIIANVSTKGDTSKHCNDNVVEVDSDRSFNLDGKRWLDEVGDNFLIDDYGHRYEYSVLSYEDLCDLADFLNNLQ